jgi:hypothetical protein
MNNQAQAPAAQVHARAVIWIDHLTARIFPMGLTGVDEKVVHAHLETEHLHHKANSIGSGHVHDDPAFLKHVVEAVQGCSEVLILGPGTEKTALLHLLQSKHPQLQVRMETCDHPTDHEIIAIGRKHFHLD